MKKVVRRANRFRNVSVSLAIAAALAHIGAVSAAPLDDQRQFFIPAQPLSSALLVFADQAGVQVMMASDTLAKFETGGISGMQSPVQALSALLRGTGLRFRVVSDKAVAIESAATSAEAETIAYQSDVGSYHVAQAEVPARADQTTVDDVLQGVDEVVVTGTYLRNSRPITPVVTLTREDLAKRGYTSLPQLMEQLPQNFTAGVSPGSNPTSGKGIGATSNQTFASGINLRGLGPSATLVLLNGRRLAPAAYAGVADISQIPINIIEKVEILTDGASGLYGSDAVAGVVNIVTVQEFSGLEIQARGTGISQGKSPNYGAGAIAGTSWEGGGGVLSVDYQKEVPLLARNRSFTGQLPGAWSLTPETEIANVFGAGHHRLADTVKLSAEGFVTQRKFGASYVPAQLAPGATPWRYDGETKQYNGSLQLDWDVASDWHAVLVGQASKENDDVDNSQPFPAVTRFPASYRVLSVEPRVDGTLFDAPGGAARVAIGTQFRSEQFAWSQFLART